MAVVVAVLVSLPWALAVHAQEPDFWNFFFWHEHIRRFAGADAQHSEPWWYYLPLLLAFSLPWVALLPVALRQAWQNRRQASIGFLLLWLLLPLAFFSLAKGKLPSYIFPCLLPLALLMGDALVDRLRNRQTRVIRINAALNLALGGLVLLALVYFQIKKPLYNNEPEHLALVSVAVIGWLLCNALQALRPLRLWAAPVLGSWLFVALLPAGLPNSVVYNKTPDQFINDHLQELSQSTRLLSNDLGAASALAWRLNRPDVALYNTVGEVKYGLAYPDTLHRRVDFLKVPQWMSEARQQGQVGVVMRINGQEHYEIDMLPQDFKRYDQGNLVILIFPKSQP